MDQRRRLASHVGVPELGAQHQKLLDAIELLDVHPDAKVDSEVIADVLDRLTWYAQAHFRAEETILAGAGYPALDEHREGHRQFRRRIAELCCAATAGVDQVPQLLKAFVDEWWDGHVLVADQDCARFLTEQSHGAADDATP